MNVILDAGHGGSDPGAVASDGTEEKVVAYETALVVRDELRSRGHTCEIVPHDAPGKTSLAFRRAFAREHHAEVFLSLHCNSNPGKPGTGVEVCYRQVRYHTRAAQLSALIAGACALRDRGAKYRTDLGVLSVGGRTGHLATTMPLLIEWAFINNPSDREGVLMRPEERHDLATAIADWLG